MALFWQLIPAQGRGIAILAMFNVHPASGIGVEEIVTNNPKLSAR